MFKTSQKNIKEHIVADLQEYVKTKNAKISQKVVSGLEEKYWSKNHY